MSAFLTNVARRGAGLAPEIDAPIASVAAPAPAWPAHAAIEQSRTDEADFGDNALQLRQPSGETNFAIPPAASPVRGRSAAISGLQHERDARIGGVARQFDPAPSPGDWSGPDLGSSVSSTSDHEPDWQSASAVPVRPMPQQSTGFGTRATEAALSPSSPSRVEASPVQAGVQAALPMNPTIAPAARTASIPIVNLPQARRQGASATAGAAPSSVQVHIGKVEIRARPPAPMRAARATLSSGFSELRLVRAHLNRDYR